LEFMIFRLFFILVGVHGFLLSNEILIYFLVVMVIESRIGLSLLVLGYTLGLNYKYSSFILLK